MEKIRGKVVYVAGKYTGETRNEQRLNVHRAENLAMRLWMAGALGVICPHKNSENFDDIVPYETFILGYVEILKRCDVMVLMKDWDGSNGVRFEIATARLYNIPVIEEKDLDLPIL